MSGVEDSEICFACLPAGGDPYLLHGWLSRRPADAGVWLISDHPEASALAESNPAITRWDTPEDEDRLPAAVSEAILGQDHSAVVIPAAIDQIPMRYRPGALMADVAPSYPLMRRVGAWGFRRVRFVAGATETAIDMPHRLDDFRDRHRGERCFVVGNGPSLQDIDMSRLKDEITLGSNRCFLGYETWGFPFTYWGVYDKYQIEEYHPVYEANVPADTVKFFPVEYASVLQVAHGCPVNCIWPTGKPRDFSNDPARLYVGFTVTYMLLQIAACMGCDPIVLIGADHRYELTRRGYSRMIRSVRRRLTRQLRGGRIYESALAAQRAWKRLGPQSGGDPVLWSTADAQSPTHFSESYTAGGWNKFLPPEPEEAERDFDEAHRWASNNDRTILNATPGTALDSFPKVDFEQLF